MFPTLSAAQGGKVEKKKRRKDGRFGKQNERRKCLERGKTDENGGERVGGVKSR